MPKPKAPASEERILHLEMEAARTLVAQLNEAGLSDDSQLLADTIEGETNIETAIGKVVESIILEDNVALEGISRAETFLKDRKSRVEDRIERKKAMILTAMQIAELKTVKTPLATITKKLTAAKVIVTDESLIPTEFFKTPEPVLDKKLLNDRVKARALLIDEAMQVKDDADRKTKLAMIEATSPPIPGAELSNGSATIQLRS
jgi:hypothetical protein